MRNVIRYYYNLVENEYYEYDNYYVITTLGGVFVFKKLFASEDEFFDLIKILNENNIQYNEIIINKDGNYVTYYENERYILMHVENFETTGKLKFLSHFFSKNNDVIADFWANRVDYYIQRIREVNLSSVVVINLFNYYIGLAENAIAVYNKCNLVNVRYNISHRRLDYPVTGPLYYDPSNMLVDTLCRDMSEYIKAKFWSSNMDIQEVRNLVSEYNLNNDEINVLFARCLYPSYFFDVLDNYFDNKCDESDFEKFLKNICSYELFLNSFYLEFCDYKLFIIDWIKKEL
jgi:hypothetical protein